jgi:hypothetical protein
VWQLPLASQQPLQVAGRQRGTHCSVEWSHSWVEEHIVHAPPPAPQAALAPT